VNSNLDTARALTVTQVAAASGALMWAILEGFKHGKATSLGLCSGILAGLVAITPAAGVVAVRGAIALGFMASVLSYMAIAIKNRLGYDDSLDVFGIHGVSGMAGALLLSFFIRPSWIAAAAEKAGGSWSGVQQLGVQAAAVGITVLYAAAVTFVLVILVEKTLGFRLTQQDEMTGQDQSLHGEQAYGLLNLS
jgi:Amt family ammonium transporter